MSSKRVLKLRSAVHDTPENEDVRRRYVDKFERIGAISHIYSEDSVMALVNIYRNIGREMENDLNEKRIDSAEYQRQQKRIQAEMDKLTSA
jgi:hypothetical protein